MNHKEQTHKEYFKLNIAGFTRELAVSREELQSVHEPLLDVFADMVSRQAARLIVFLAGPPGSGKSTLATLWEVLAMR